MSTQIEQTTINTQTESVVIPNMIESTRTVKSGKKFITEFKAKIETAIDYMNTQYSRDHTTTDTNIKNMLTTGYQHIFELNSMLDIHIIKEENQSNKILCQEARENLIPVHAFKGALHDLLKDHVAYENDAIHSIAKTRSSTSDSSIIDMVMQQYIRGIEMTQMLKNNGLINLINLTALSLVKTREILNKI
jgi:hypothetical protein